MRGKKKKKKKTYTKQNNKGSSPIIKLVIRKNIKKEDIL